jgi:serine/threonine-protein kinase RsbW
VLTALERAGALKDEAGLVRARLCLDEALVNAVMHGSGFNAAKRVVLRAYVRKDGWSVRVEDEGSGFRDEDLPDPEALENLLEEGGRGVHLMRSMLSELSYWRGGRVLVMTQKAAEQPASGHAADPDSPAPAAEPGTGQGQAHSKNSGKTPARKRRSTRKSARA